ncbi:MarR family transcriptional regulator [Agrobacterium tumefaciens]|uniref:MarR family transcriptional regulator n=1 Tax=Agrobacterium tumefaciens TaxID=358 RepID=UPI002244C90E|nr:helix-turn-helix domain-containing protein [Agrobacterium tumefaciens]MCW8060545.1 MarR family transcriptional regulator [Agrobacterium tumefaciens]MCW8145988.1 MarR family transcriptional regulator [Agrobacterium tumefaciens]
MADGISSARTRVSMQFIMDLALNQILFDPFGDETPGARLRQFGLMAVLLDLKSRNEPLTVTRIVEITGMTRGAAQEILEALETRGLVTSTWVKNTKGRGKAREYGLRDNIRLSTE